ncbi:MAG: helix-turn-helix domain-containing protein [bacterium]|nr:helix-turn-helix domain-containing protein [bacterium]
MLKNADQQRLAAQLNQFGCNPREAQVYLQCSQLGPSSVQELARRMKMNRVTVHSAVEQMIEKGFLYETRKGKRRLIVAEEPDVLYRLLQRRKNELSMMEMNLDQVVKLLNSVHVSDRGVPTVRFYEGVEGFKKMLEETLSARGEVLVCTYVQAFQAILEPEYLEHYYVRRAKKGIHTRLIFPPCPFVERIRKKIKQWNMTIRLLPPQLKWSSGFFLWNDTLALMSYTEGKLTTTIIENKDITDFVGKVMFELIWQQAEPIG